jgi:hypothetical protein
VTGRARRGGLFLPLLLIALGILFLVERLGGAPVDIGEILSRWWPVLLIAFGIDLVFSHRTVGHWIAGILLAAFVALALLMFVGGGWGAVSEPIAQPLDGAQGAEVTIACEAGLQLGSGAGEGTLVAGTVALGRWETLVHTYRLEGGVARLVLEEHRGALFPRWKRDWSLRLNSSVPLLLDVTCGVGRADLDLADLTLGELVLTSGGGGADVVLPAVNGLHVRIRGGGGAVSVALPRGVGVRVQVVREAGKLALPPEYTRAGADYVSPDYGTAVSRVDLEVEVGSGGMTIRLGAGGTEQEEGPGRTI